MSFRRLVLNGRAAVGKEANVGKSWGLQLLGLGNPNDMTNACSYPLGRWIVMGEGEQVGSGGGGIET